jgi:N-acetyl-alpha-D-muramate 1-phosphate uridylyltransferase
MQCVILAGGLGTRMRAISSELPKALLPVAGRPFLFHQLDQLADEGVSEVVLLVGYKSHLIVDAVDGGGPWPLEVRYVDEGENLRGTAGALRCALDAGVLKRGFFVLYGDSYLPIAFRPVWEYSRGGADAVMTVLRNEGRWDRSNAAFSDGRVVRYDKWCAEPSKSGLHYIDYGLLVLNTRVIEQFVPASSPYDLAHVFAALSGRGELLGYEVSNRFYEIGSPEGLQQFEQYLGRCREPEARSSVRG